MIKLFIMAKIVKLAFLALLILGCYNHETLPGRPSHNLLELSSFVSRVTTEHGIGSAVWISPDTLVTAAHVISGSLAIIVDGSPGTAISIDANIDLAIIRVSGYADKEFATIGGCPELYSRCVSIGYQHGLATPTITEGFIEWLDDGDKSMRYSAPGWFGCSGGGLFVNGKLVGITQKIYTGGGESNPAIPHLMLSCRTIDLIEIISSVHH